MNILRKIIFILLLGLALQCCVSAAITGAGLAYDHNNVSRKASDLYIKTQLQNTFAKNPDFKDSRIAVTVFHHLVLLTGQMSNDDLKQQAIALAKQTQDVQRVYQGLTVGPTISLATQTMDTWITAKIKSKIIAAKETDPEKIKVVTEDGVVYLIGIVTKAQADAATQLAQNTSGVKKIVAIFFYVVMPDIN